MDTMKRITSVAVTGATGFIGSRLVAALRERGYGVVAVGRGPDGLPDARALAGADAVIHLAGESVDGRWTDEKKRAIYDSRIAGTRALVDALAAREQKPSVLVCASATGYYGNRGDEVLDERSSPGDDFLAHVCVDWEREAARANDYGIRSVSLRTGIVLDAPGGALEKMAMPFRLGAGGPLGSGKQFFPWIHREDLVRAYIFALETQSVRGGVNAVAPDYVRNARFGQALGAAFHRPALLPVPGFALRAMLGEFADSILGGQLVVPAVLEDAGFTWEYPLLEEALSHIYRSNGASGLLRTFSTEHTLARPIDEVFAFFSDPRNLETITPPNLNFCITHAPETLHRGALIEYRLSLRGVPFSWKTMISDWNPPFGFEDVQLSGPYALWRHRHRFTETASGTRIADDVVYALAAQPLSNVMRSFVSSEVESIFAFRRDAIGAAFPG